LAAVKGGPQVARRLRSGFSEADKSAQRMARPTASQLLELGSDIEFFYTSDRDAFASVNVGDHWETFPIDGRDFAHVLLHRFYSFTSGAPSKQALEDAIRVFTCRALFEGTEQSVFLRIAECDGKTYLDLADPDWNAVEISAGGWKIVANPPVKFLRPRGMRPLPSPVAGGDVNQLRSFLNITDQEWPLTLV